MAQFKGLPNLDYVTADLESPLADVKMDIHEMPFDDNSFDALLCNHVLEHVADDKKAMREIRRVLRSSGWAILQVPFFNPIPDVTYEDKSITNPREREKYFGQNDHLRKYGKDYPHRLEEAGFRVTVDRIVREMDSELVERYGLMKGEDIYVVRKSGN